MKAITEKITRNQKKQLKRFMEDMVSKMGLSKKEAQEIIANFGRVKPDLEKALRKHNGVDNYFGEPFEEFEMTVPMDYDHDTQIDTFSERMRKEKDTYHYDKLLTSKNFAKATNKLVPGKTYWVSFIPILQVVPSGDYCVAFLRKKNAILVGAQGLTLAYDLKKEAFSLVGIVASFDEKKSLYKDANGSPMVPWLYRYSGGEGQALTLAPFNAELNIGGSLLCFRQIPAYALR